MSRIETERESVRTLDTGTERAPNHSHAWRGSWDRPMKIDENSVHPLTVARMTDHNVRGTDETWSWPSKVDRKKSA